MPFGRRINCSVVFQKERAIYVAEPTESSPILGCFAIRAFAPPESAWSRCRLTRRRSRLRLYPSRPGALARLPMEFCKLRQRWCNTGTARWTGQGLEENWSVSPARLVASSWNKGAASQLHGRRPRLILYCSSIVPLVLAVYFPATQVPASTGVQCRQRDSGWVC
jgi:hypothetical protein